MTGKQNSKHFRSKLHQRIWKICIKIKEFYKNEHASTIVCLYQFVQEGVRIIYGAKEKNSSSQFFLTLKKVTKIVKIHHLLEISK